MRSYLVDFSTLASASKGRSSYALEGGYLREGYGTQGLTQLLDTARVVDLIVLSDSLVTSDRVSSFDGGLGGLARYIPLSRDPGYFDQFAVPATTLTAASEEIEQIERLLNLQIVNDFTYEIEHDLTAEDRAFVKSSAKCLAGLGIKKPKATDEVRERSFPYVVARTLQYLQTADLNKLPYVCHNFRSPIVRAVRPRLSNSSPDLYRECETALQRWLAENFGDSRLEFSLPIFFLAAVKEAHSNFDILRIAEQLRDSPEARRIRELLSEINDENGGLHLLRYAELRRVAEEETKKFKKKFAPHAEETTTGMLGAEFSATPTSLSAKVSIDMMKLSKAAVKWLTEYKDRSSIAVIFKTARDVYEVLSVDQDIERLWKAQLTERHKEILRGVQRCCDAPESLNNLEESH